MDFMPDSILLSIFSHLNLESLCLGARLVNSRWRGLTFDQSLWRKLSVPNHLSDVRLLLLVSPVHEYLEEFDMGSCNCLSTEGIQDIAELKFPSLKKLIVPFSSMIDEEVFSRLAKSAPSVREIENIHSAYNEKFNPLECQRQFPELAVIHDQPISTFGRLRTNPSPLDRNKRAKWSNSLADIAPACPNITSYRCNRGLEYIDTKGLELISALFPYITSLELRSCMVDDKALLRFFENSEVQGGLREVTFDKPGTVSDKGLEVIADNCPNLLYLKLARCSGITNKGLQYVLRKCKELTDIHVNTSTAYLEYDTTAQAENEEVDNATLADIGEHSKKLTYLRIYYSNKITKDGMVHVVSGCPLLYGLMMFQCSQFCTESMELLHSCRFLQSVIIVNCDKITPSALISFVLVTATLKRLTFYTKNVDFREDMSDLAEKTYMRIDSEAGKFRPNAITKLALRGVGGGFLQLLTVLCPNLLTLDMRDSAYIREWSMISVLKNCELLEYLDIASMEDAGDELLAALCQNARCLRVLTLGTAVRQMSTSALIEITKTCPSLRALEMDITGADINETLLVENVKQHHGGHCCLYVEKQDTGILADIKQRYIELHFTPIKYLNSINQSNVTQ